MGKNTRSTNQLTTPGDNTQCHRSHQPPPTNQPLRQEKPRSKYGETVAPTHRGNTVTKTVVQNDMTSKSTLRAMLIEVKSKIKSLLCETQPNRKINSGSDDCSAGQHNTMTTTSVSGTAIVSIYVDSLVWIASDGVSGFWANDEGILADEVNEALNASSLGSSRRRRD